MIGLAIAAALVLGVDAGADTQIPMRHGALQDDERAVVLDLLLRPPISGKLLLHELEMQPLEVDAKFELWMRSLQAAWIADAADGLAVLPPAGPQREEVFRRFRFFARDDWDLRSVPELDTIFPIEEIRRMAASRYLNVGRLRLPDRDAELLFVVVSHSAHCGSAGCESPLLLKQDGKITIVGHYQPSYARNGACAIVLESRTNGVNDLLELADPEGIFLHRWDDRGYEREQLAPRPSTTCCAGDIDITVPTQCPTK